MKVNSYQLNNYLKQNLAPIYLLSGDEPLLVNEAKNAIYQAAARQEFKQREILHMESNIEAWQN